jgi:hypothetical protein
MQVMLNLMRGVDRQPPQASASGLRESVHDGLVPVVGTKATKHTLEKSRRLLNLYRDVTRILLVVAVMLDALVTAHRKRLVFVATTDHQHSLALDDQHVPYVAPVLEA